MNYVSLNATKELHASLTHISVHVARRLGRAAIARLRKECRHAEFVPEKEMDCRRISLYKNVQLIIEN